MKACSMIKVKLPAWNGKAVDEEVTQEIIRAKDAEYNSGNFVKTILEDELKGLTSKIAKTRNYVKDNTLPWLDGGWRIIPNSELETLLKGVQEHWDEVMLDVTCVAVQIPNFLEKEKRIHGDMFKVTDYPTQEQFISRYKMRISVQEVKLDWRNQEKPTGISQEMFDLQRKTYEEAERAVVSKNWQDIYEMAQNFIKQLSKDDCKVKSTLIDNTKEMCTLLRKLNIFEDPGLENVTKLIENKLTKYSAKELREDEFTKNEVLAEAENLQKMASNFLDNFI